MARGDGRGHNALNSLLHVHLGANRQRTGLVSSDHDKPTASGGAPEARLRPRTIDLTADEVAPEPARHTVPDAPEATPPDPADHAAPRMEASSDTSAASDTASGAPPPDSPADPPPRRRGWLPAGVSMIGAGVLGAGIVLGVLGSMGLLVNPNDGLSAGDSRLGGLELEVRDLAARAPAAGVNARAFDEVVGRPATREAPVAASPPA